MELLFKIENEFKKEIKKIDYWPFFRRLIGSYLLHLNRNQNTLLINKNNFKTKIFQLIHSLKGLKYIFRKNEIIIFGLNDNLREYNGDI